MKKVQLLAWGALLLWATACAAQDEAPPQSSSVTVSATRDPVQKSYRKIVKGMDLFAANQHYAPAASLRFRLLPRLDGVKMDGISIRVVGDQLSLNVPVAPDNSFMLERSQAALDEDAQVIPNRKASSITWRALVTTPGLPPDTRRLGDLRLECMVGMGAGLISNRSFLADLLRSPKPKDCDEPSNSIYLFFADKAIFSVTLQDGARRESMSMVDLYAGYRSYKDERLASCDCQAMLEKTYFVPLWDHTWSDDTRITFDYMDEPANGQTVEAQLARGGTPLALSVVAGKTTGAELGARAKPRRRVELPNGFESWMYAVEPAVPVAPAKQDGQPPKAELVVLIDPAGVVRKARVREPSARRTLGG